MPWRKGTLLAFLHDLDAPLIDLIPPNPFRIDPTYLKLHFPPLSGSGDVSHLSTPTGISTTALLV